MTSVHSVDGQRRTPDLPPPNPRSRVGSVHGPVPGVVIGGLIAAVSVAAMTTDSGSDATVLCPFRRCTGAYCPGCGGTRAIARLFRGDLIGAWHQHPYVVLLAVQTLIFGGISLTETGRRRLRGVWLPLVSVNVAVLFVMWAFRLAIGDIPLDG